jgi:hypothetical protein
LSKIKKSAPSGSYIISPGLYLSVGKAIILPLLSNVYGLNPLYLDKTSGDASLLNLVTLKAV